MLIVQRSTWSRALVAGLLVFATGVVVAQGSPPETIGEGGIDERTTAGVAPHERGIEDNGLRDSPALRGRPPFGTAAGEIGGPSAATSGNSRGRSALRSVGWLIVIVGGSLASLWILRRPSGGTPGERDRRSVRVLGRGAVGPKHQVVVTQVGERVLILGVSADRITSLGEVSDPGEAMRWMPDSGRDVTLAEVDERPAGDASRDEDERLAPYRREIQRLQGMLEEWQREAPEVPAETSRILEGSDRGSSDDRTERLWAETERSDRARSRPGRSA